MTLTRKVQNLINKINALHIEDPKIYDYWDELTEVLSEDEKETIQFIDNLEDKNAVNTISSVFEDVADNLNSQAFITCIKSLQTKFPDLLLEHMVDAAQEAINIDDSEP